MSPKPERASSDLHEDVDTVLLPRLLEYVERNLSDVSENFTLADLVDKGVGFILPKTTAENRARVSHVREALKDKAKRAAQKLKPNHEPPFVISDEMREEARQKAEHENLPPEHQ